VLLLFVIFFYIPSLVQIFLYQCNNIRHSKSKLHFCNSYILLCLYLLLVNDDLLFHTLRHIFHILLYTFETSINNNKVMDKIEVLAQG